MKKIFIQITTAVACFIAYFQSLAAYARSQLITNIPEIRPIEGTAGNAMGTITTALLTIIDWMLGLAGALAVVYLIWGGIQYITGGSKGAEAGKGTIINAIIGIAIIMLVLIIINMVTSLLGGGGSTAPTNAA